MGQISIVIPKTKPTTLTIKSNDQELLEHFYNNMTPFVIFTSGNNCSEWVSIEKCLKGYKISYKGKEVFAANTDHLLRIINRFINNSITTEFPFLAIHCAVLAKRNCNFLFVGETGAGKSTLSAYLSCKGFKYYTDDKTIINCVSKEIIPFSKPVHIRRLGLEVLKNYGMKLSVEKVLFAGEERFYFRPQNYEINMSNSIKIIFIQRNVANVNEMNRVSRNEALDKIANHLLFVGDLTASVKCALYLVNDVQCYEMNYSQLNKVDEMLLELS